jgi:HAD superfamily hydrolase (TIGR01509 family)
MQQKLEAIGLTDEFDVTVAPGDQHAPKPDPSMFEHVLSRLDASRERTVHIGNSRVSDVAGARAAGLRSVWVPTEVDGRNGPDPTWISQELWKLTDPPWP